jgi:hypothetical protein
MTLNEKLTRGRPHERDEAILVEIVVAPAGARKFTAYLDDRELCTSTKPFLDAARVLIAEGVHPATVLAMRHEGNNTLTLRSTVGTAAGWRTGDARRRLTKDIRETDHRGGRPWLRPRAKKRRAAHSLTSRPLNSCVR